MFQPSEYQKEIFDWIQEQESQSRKGQHHLVVTAGPGSGKTTTLVQAASLIKNKEKAVFVAFNKHIATELQEKLPHGMTASTLHSLGLKAISRKTGKFPKIEGKYHRNLAQDWVMKHQNTLMLNAEDWADMVDDITKLTRLCQMTMTSPLQKTQVKEMIWRYGLDMPVNINRILEAVNDVLNQVIDNAANMIDFDDMIWLPASQGWKPRQYDVIMADEVQDFNAAQQKLVQMMLSPSGYGVWVGDRKQAIYGFTYASVKGIDEIIQQTKANTLPLSICYRCPEEHVKLARSIFQSEGYKLEARHNAPKGIIKDIWEADIIDLVKPGDLIISRINAPLVPLCFQLIREGIAARIKGRDIGANLITLIKKVEKQVDGGINWKDPYESFYKWLDGQESILTKQIKDPDSRDSAIQQTKDKVDTILAIWDGKQPKTQDAMVKAINDLFAEEGATVWLSTIHKAKGLEADNVFIVMPSKMPHPMAKKPWEIEQEYNMKFVALTRSKQSLYFAWEQDEPGCPLTLQAA
jgi:superfamily I DNA/RNA helicase